MANFLVSDAADARSIAQQKLLKSFRQQDGAAYWDQRYGYYEQNWVWFALALLDNQLPNLAAS